MKLGGYPRLWWTDGTHQDVLRRVSPDASEDYEAKWNAVGVKVEWLLSPRGRLDRVLPQTLPRLVHNANARSGREHKIRY